MILGDTDENGHQLRPHIVWFGEMVPMLKTAAEITQQADILIIVGTSMQVYPAASLIHYTPEDTPIYFIDPRPNIKQSDFKNLIIIPKTASEGTPELVEQLINN